jgi:hypothetical protein
VNSNSTDLPIGTPVRYWTGIREGEGKTSHTRTEVRMLGGHTPVVWVEGEPSCIALTHVESIEDSDDAAIAERALNAIAAGEPVIAWEDVKTRLDLDETPLPRGPIAEADAWQTLKPRGREYERLVLSVEIGARALSHAVEVTR